MYIEALFCPVSKNDVTNAVACGKRSTAIKDPLWLPLVWNEKQNLLVFSRGKRSFILSIKIVFAVFTKNCPLQDFIFSILCFNFVGLVSQIKGFSQKTGSFKSKHFTKYS